MSTQAEGVVGYGDDVSDYFDVYPDQNRDGEEFTKQISKKQEFRMLSHQGFTNGLFNRQELVVRILSPGTGIKKALLDSYMGTGKTRIPFIVAQRHNFGSKPLLLSPGDTIEAVHLKEINNLYGNITRTEINKKFEIEHYGEFVRKVQSIFSQPNGENTIKAMYGNRVIFADEIHYLRESGKIKESYNIFHKFLHTIEGTSIVILASGTTMLNDAAEIYLLNLLLPQDKQMDKNKLNDVINSEDNDKYRTYFHKYFPGFIVYFNKDPGITPPMVTRGDFYYSEAMNQYTKYPIVAHKMGEYQNYIYNELLAIDKTSLKHKLFHALTFTFPLDTENTMTDEQRISNTINFDYYAESFLLTSGASRIGEFKKEFRTWSNTLTDIDEIKKCSMKLGEIIEDIENTPDKCRFLHFSYVEMGVVIMGLLLEKRGYTYYNGEVPLNPKIDSKQKRYAVIAGKSTVFRIGNVIDASNMVENKYGEYLHIVLGSPKSGEGISFTNMRAFDYVNPSFHDGKEAQAESRVFRPFSLNNFDKSDPQQYNIQVSRHASVSDDFKFSRDVEMYFLSDGKSERINMVSKIENEFAMNTYLSSYHNKNNVDPKYDHLQLDYHSYVNNKFYSNDERQHIIFQLKRWFMFQFILDVNAITIPDLIKYDKKLLKNVLVELCDNNTMFRNRFGFQCLLRGVKNIYYLQHDDVVGTRNRSIDSAEQSNTIYHHNRSSIFDFIRPHIYNEIPSFVEKNIKLIKKKKLHKEFISEYLDQPMDFKIVSLETALTEDTLAGSREVRDMVIKIMSNNWFVIPGRSCIVHTLHMSPMDRLHYSANVEELKNSDKIKIFDYNDNIPKWRFVTNSEQPNIYNYINTARRLSEAKIADKSDSLYGILNTSDNLFRLKVITPRDQKNKKMKTKGFICMDASKKTIIYYLYKFDLKPPEVLVKQYGNDSRKKVNNLIKQKNIVFPTLNRDGQPLTAEESKKLAMFYYIWYKSDTKMDICPTLQNYFSKNGQLYLK